MKFSVVIPAHNEEVVIASTLDKLLEKLNASAFEFEILVVADHCTDGTVQILADFAKSDDRIRWIENKGKPGFGMAVRAGFEEYKGDAVAVYMADASDGPDDLCKYFNRISKGAECVFGSRFIKGSRVVDYPKHKYFLNRFVNYLIKFLFRHGLNDTTNAFKCYRRLFYWAESNYRCLCRTDAGPNARHGCRCLGRFWKILSAQCCW
jgi:dolichol-phosphate mannosyltransferase